MVVQFYPLQYSLYKAEYNQQLQNYFLVQDRAYLEQSSNVTQDQAKVPQLQTESTKETENLRTPEETLRHNPWHRAHYGEGEEQKEEEKKPESPDGKGTIIDLNA